MAPNGSSSPASGPSARTNGGSASLDHDLDTPRIQKRPRRTHARRSCLMCQQRKARCELPDLDVPSSSLPLPDHQACHRCRTLQISCIVDDANKRKAKVSIGESSTSRPAPSKRRASSAADRPGIRKSSTTTSLSSNPADTTSLKSQANSSSTSLGVTDAEANNLKLAGGREVGDQIVYPAEARLVSKTPDPSSDEDDSSPPISASRPSDPANNRAASAGSEHIRTQYRNPRDAANIDTWERFSTRSRPLTLLTELVPRQNGFASKVFRLVSARATIETDVTEIVSNEKSKQLSDWCENNLTLWMPHISNAYQIRQEALQGKQTLSTQLLEQVLYLIAMQHIRDPADDVTRFSVTRFVIRDLARLMLTSPRSPKAVEALELLALFPVDVSAIPGPSRNRIRSDSQINAAERFARSVRLDRVALTAAAPYSFFTSTNQLDDFETKRTAMAWASVKTWYNCFTLGDDELYESIDLRFFSDDWSRSLVLPQEEPDSRQERLDVPDNELFASRRWSSKRRIGSVGLAMRCLAMRQLLKAFDAIANAPIDVAESHRLGHLSRIVDDYRDQTVSVDQEFQRHLPADSSDGSEVLRTWLNIEMTAGHLLVLGAAIWRGLGIDKKENVPGDQLVLLMRGENASPEMRHFLTHHGETLILGAEKVLVNISHLCRDARVEKTSTTAGGARSRKTADVTSHRWMVEGQSRTVLPMMNVCGFALEAAFNAMEMHATMFKLWKTPPKRSESWQLVFSNVVTAMTSLDPKGSIQNGSIPATCAYILQGMLKVIVCWTDCSRKKEHQRTVSSSSATAIAVDAEGPGQEQRRTRQNGAAPPQAQERRTGAPDPELERYSALLKDDFSTRKSFDAVQAYGSSPPGPASRPGPARPSQGEAFASSHRSMASPLDWNASFSQSGPPKQRHGPDATESLAAALPHSTLPAEHAAQIPHHLAPHEQQNPYGQYRAAPPIGASGSSNASSHTHTPPQYYANGNEGVSMMNTGSNGSSFSMVGNAGNAADGVAFDSLDFILNDVLGSSEWSSVLQDIWRTDM